ncbi:PREDICTED: uncharacterized protein LOC18602037 [Theobroma cacao]|uniref:Uncharacterized protein LOC18602037 n=1 Tax=Theobroma cacao TaxID=3641 RepID=A0AB32W977_THECC|nr:PREDICTED: uncharacterized protein LOC18602037 [Theobroma cacao]
MTIEFCPAETIPRISFSHDFGSSTISPMQQYCPLRSTSLPLNSSIDFEFDVRINSIDQECYSSADELFSNGKILPIQIKKNISPSKQDQQQPTSHKPQPQARNASSNDIEVATKEPNDQNQSSKSFRQFKRSSSLNFVSGYKRRLCPSKLLSGSSSTGSAPKVKPGPVLKDGHGPHGIGNHRQNNQKEKSLPCLQSSTSNQKSPLKKSFTYGSHGNGVTINPVLNVPLVDIFCLSSVFPSGKDKRK